MGKRIPLDTALATASANRYGRMVGRARDNRIEPECWPHVEPSFHFTKEQKFFATGSCFATNISRRLALDGYDVHGGMIAAEGNRRNRYTPPAIHQELAWAKAIFDRDDEPREEDIRPLLVEFGDGRWVDMWAPRERGSPANYEEAIAARSEVYRFFRGAFIADVVIITLGLIEAWWDKVSQSYVEFDTPWARRSDRDRLEFEKLSFETCKDYVDRTLKLVLNGQRRVLITTSPVMLGRTFTDKDVIVAHTHSKSVLRAVAGELSDQYEGVDYFPSYEIATMTRRPEVWEDDLIHIEPNFIARIMQHVTSAYVPGSLGTDERALMKMANLVAAMQFDEAEEIYTSAGESLWSSPNPAVHAAGMTLNQASGKTELAVRHALMLDRDDPLLYVNHPDWMFAAAHLLRKDPNHRQVGERMANSVRDACRNRRKLYQQLLVSLERTGNDGALRDLVELIYAEDVDDPAVAHKASVLLQKRGDLPRALEICERQLQRTPNHHRALTGHVRVLISLNRIEDSLVPLRRLIDLDAEDQWAHITLVRMLNRLGRLSDALQAADTLLAHVSGDPQGTALKAWLLWKADRKAEASEAARFALEAAPGDPIVAQYAQSVLRGVAA